MAPTEQNRADIDIRVATTEADKRNLNALCEAVYVREQGRLEHAEDWARTLDKYDPFSTYFIAYRENRAVGSVRVTADSGVGLPCEHAIDLGVLRENHKLVEIGHWICLPELRGKGAGMLLMRTALTFGMVELQATHILADIFIEAEASAKTKFYRLLGFRPLCEVYYDHRFTNGPASTIVVLEAAQVLKRREDRRRIRDLRAASNTTV